MTGHPDLQLVKSHLQQIYDSISHFQPLTARPPIIDSSFEGASESNEESQWLKQENVPGLKKLKENIGIDLIALDKFLDDPACANLPPLSTNSPYLIAVWNEVLCAPAPIVSIFKTFLINNSTSASDASRKKDARPSGVKVDVVADNGRHWIRVNTAKNSRLLSEFREIDSYITDSESELDDDAGPSLAQTQLDNSVLRMGKSLLDAARANPIDGTTAEIPKVTLRLTRLEPTLTNDDGTEPDARITQTLESLQEMGIDVQLGERIKSELPITTNAIIERPCSPSLPFIPTLNINLDLSILIALISDLIHAPLPASLEDANKRFLPPPEYREWKKQKMADNQKPPRNYKSTPPQPTSMVEMDINDLPNDLIKHSRALTNQLLQEMGRGLLQEMHDRISALCSDDPTKLKVTFWTTPEARDRCLRIISKIGGVHEKRRAHALFCYDTGTTGGRATIPLDEALRLYWQDSRFKPNFVPLLPIHLYPTSSIPTLIPGSSSISSQEIPIPRSSISSFSKSLDIVCADILAQETMPHPRALPDEVVGTSEIQRATVLKANPRLTAHTIQSMHWGAYLGWTTLTANRTSVKAILREMKTARVSGRLASVDLHLEQRRGSGDGRLLEGDGDSGDDNDKGGSAGWAAFWVVDPRSLAEVLQSTEADCRVHLLFLFLIVIIWIYGTRCRMSSKIESKKELEKHYDWAFDISTHFRSMSDEDSESDSDQKLANTNTGDRRLLFDDLDLSKRGENVAYNPNPFSIAKINAAYRRQTGPVQSPIQPVRPSDQNLATTDTGAYGLLIDDLDPSKREDNVAYNPNPFSTAKVNTAYRRQTGPVQSPIQPVRPSDQKPATTNTGATGLLIDDLDLSEREDNDAYNPNSFSIAKTNAAHRPSQAITVNGPLVQATQLVRPAKKSAQTQWLTKRSRTNSNQTTIMEGFKTQAMKKPRINNASQLRVSPLLPTNSNPNLAVNKSPVGLFPSESASLISSPSESPKQNNYLAKMRTSDDSSSSFLQVKSYPKRDAYQYLTKDLDEEWTTLPSKKKKRRPKTGNPTFNKPFHIPGLRLPPTMKAETVATSAAPKVKVYLPPPLKFVNVKRPTSSKNSGYCNKNELSMEGREDGRDVSSSSPRSFYTDAYLSPGPSSSKRSPSFSHAKRARNYTPPRSRPGVRMVAPYRPPSPPTSDLPIPSDADIHVEVDHGGIQSRYAEMKRLSRKRRRASAEVWNLMGVDSCGYVWKDVEGGGQGEQMEIQIVVWNGLPPA